MAQTNLFSSAFHLPMGMAYQEDFLSAATEGQLLRIINELPLHEAQYREWTAKRRIVSYGGRYDFTAHRMLEALPLPDWLMELRNSIASWVNLPAAEFTHAIVAEYQPGTQLGWHRDVPNFETIVGISLAGNARMRLRAYPPQRGDRSTVALELTPRSIYALQGDVRWNWQHAISPTKGLRYSITFRTLRR